MASNKQRGPIGESRRSGSDGSSGLPAGAGRGEQYPLEMESFLPRTNSAFSLQDLVEGQVRGDLGEASSLKAENELPSCSLRSVDSMSGGAGDASAGGDRKLGDAGWDNFISDAGPLFRDDGDGMAVNMTSLTDMTRWISSSSAGRLGSTSGSCSGSSLGGGESAAEAGRPEGEVATGGLEGIGARGTEIAGPSGRQAWHHTGSKQQAGRKHHRSPGGADAGGQRQGKSPSLQVRDVEAPAGTSYRRGSWDGAAQLQQQQQPAGMYGPGPLPDGGPGRPAGGMLMRGQQGGGGGEMGDPPAPSGGDPVVPPSAAPGAAEEGGSTRARAQAFRALRRGKRSEDRRQQSHPGGKGGMGGGGSSPMASPRIVAAGAGGAGPMQLKSPRMGMGMEGQQGGAMGRAPQSPAGAGVGGVAMMVGAAGGGYQGMGRQAAPAPEGAMWGQGQQQPGVPAGGAGPSIADRVEGAMWAQAQQRGAPPPAPGPMGGHLGGAMWAQEPQQQQQVAAAAAAAAMGMMYSHHPGGGTVQAQAQPPPHMIGPPLAAWGQQQQGGGGAGGGLAGAPPPPHPSGAPGPLGQGASQQQGGQPPRGGVAGPSPPESLPLEGLLSIIEKLDMPTRRSMKDSLYRLAYSATMRSGGGGWGAAANIPELAELRKTVQVIGMSDRSNDELDRCVASLLYSVTQVLPPELHGAAVGDLKIPYPGGMPQPGLVTNPMPPAAMGMMAQGGVGGMQGGGGPWGGQPPPGVMDAHGFPKTPYM